MEICHKNKEKSNINRKISMLEKFLQIVFIGNLLLSPTDS